MVPSSSAPGSGSSIVIDRYTVELICTRCTSPVCAICSRTCTASPTSMPPTPHLTRSPTPTPPPSPRRSAPLSLNTWNTNLSDSQRGMIVGTTSGTKRRKAANEHYEANPDAMEHALGEFNLAEGCGRTICRNCSTENVERLVILECGRYYS